MAIEYRWKHAGTGLFLTEAQAMRLPANQVIKIRIDRKRKSCKK